MERPAGLALLFDWLLFGGKTDGIVSSSQTHKKQSVCVNVCVCEVCSTGATGGRKGWREGAVGRGGVEAKGKGGRLRNVWRKKNQQNVSFTVH